MPHACSVPARLKLAAGRRKPELDGRLSRVLMPGCVRPGYGFPGGKSSCGARHPPRHSGAGGSPASRSFAPWYRTGPTSTWFPACAGMTASRPHGSPTDRWACVIRRVTQKSSRHCFELSRHSGAGGSPASRCFAPWYRTGPTSTWYPACAGMTASRPRGSPTDRWACVIRRVTQKPSRHCFGLSRHSRAGGNPARPSLASCSRAVPTSTGFPACAGMTASVSRHGREARYSRSWRWPSAARDSPLRHAPRSSATKMRYRVSGSACDQELRPVQPCSHAWRRRRVGMGSPPV